jgi:hypothetical protein
MCSRSRIAIAGLFAFCLAGATIPEAQADEAKSVGSLLANYHFRRVHMERTGADLFVRVSIDSRPATLVVDTGSPFTTLDRNTIAAYRLNEMQTSLGLNSSIGHTSEHVGLGRLRSIELANIVLSNDAFTVVDLSAMNSGKPVRAAGVFGLSHMRKLGAVIDCGQRALYLNPHGATPDSEAKLEKFLTSRGFVRIPIRVNPARLPEVDCRINGLESKIVIETAAFTTILEKQVAFRAGVRLAETGFRGEGVGKLSAAISSGLAKQFSVGTFQTQNQKLSAQEGSFAVLGIDYLSAHDAVIDCGGMTLFLRHRP